jgi:hypothetical protein
LLNYSNIVSSCPNFPHITLMTWFVGLPEKVCVAYVRVGGEYFFDKIEITN